MLIPANQVRASAGTVIGSSRTNPSKARPSLADESFFGRSASPRSQRRMPSTVPSADSSSPAEKSANTQKSVGFAPAGASRTVPTSRPMAYSLRPMMAETAVSTRLARVAKRVAFASSAFQHRSAWAKNATAL